MSSFSRKNVYGGEIPVKVLADVFWFPFNNIELIYASLLILSLFGWKIKVPFFSIGKDRKRDTFMECVLEELSISPLSLADRLYFYENHGPFYMAASA